MNKSEILTAVQSLILGDLSQIESLRSISHSEIQMALEKQKLPKLTQKTVLEILTQFSKGLIPQTTIKHWALLMLRGIWGTWQTTSLVKDSKLNAIAIEIVFEPSFEDQIVETLSRLDELGDAVDGKLNQTDLNKMIQTLSSK